MGRRVRRLEAGTWVQFVPRVVFLLPVLALLGLAEWGPSLGLPLLGGSLVLVWLLATRVTVRRDPRVEEWRPGTHGGARDDDGG